MIPRNLCKRNLHDWKLRIGFLEVSFDNTLFVFGTIKIGFFVSKSNAAKTRLSPLYIWDKLPTRYPEGNMIESLSTILDILDQIIYADNQKKTSLIENQDHK